VIVLLAHGAGAAMDSPFIAAMASGLAGTGWRVVRFVFPSMARMRETGRRQGPYRMPVLQEAFRQQMQLEKTEQPGRPIFIGDKSMGGRVASLLVDELAASDGVRGCLCLGYPFHPPGPSGHGRRWRAMASQPKFSCTGSAAATKASSPPRARASARRGTGPRPLITVTASCGNT
jgi:predicted alpha/beta-hydrolase family hydrolase